VSAGSRRRRAGADLMNQLRTEFTDKI
jgi:hypothetical protein